MRKTRIGKQAPSGFSGAWAPGGRVSRAGVAALFLFGLAFVLIGAIPALQALPVLLDGQRAPATVSRVQQLPQPNQYRAWVDFNTATGQHVQTFYDLADRRRMPRLAPGARIELFYAATDPQRVELNVNQSTRITSWWWLVPGLFLLWLSSEARKSRLKNT